VVQTNRFYTEIDDELRAEYDWPQLKGGVRSKYMQCYSAGSNLVLLAPDVWEGKKLDVTKYEQV